MKNNNLTTFLMAKMLYTFFKCRFRYYFFYFPKMSLNWFPSVKKRPVHHEVHRKISSLPYLYLTSKEICLHSQFSIGHIFIDAICLPHFVLSHVSFLLFKIMSYFIWRFFFHSNYNNKNYLYLLPLLLIWYISLKI